MIRLVTANLDWKQIPGDSEKFDHNGCDKVKKRTWVFDSSVFQEDNYLSEIKKYLFNSHRACNIIYRIYRAKS